MVIPEIPVRAVHEFDVRPQRHESAARFKATKRLVERMAERFLARQVFKKVAREHEVQSAGVHLPCAGAILLQESNVRIQTRFRIRVQIHREFMTRANVIDELAVATAEVEDRAGFSNELLEKLRY